MPQLISAPQAFLKLEKLGEQLPENRNTRRQVARNLRRTMKISRGKPQIQEGVCLQYVSVFSQELYHIAYQMSDHCLQDQRAFYCLWFVMLKNREYFSLCIYSRFGRVHTSQQEL